MIDQHAYSKSLRGSCRGPAARLSGEGGTERIGERLEPCGPDQAPHPAAPALGLLAVQAVVTSITRKPEQ